MREWDVRQKVASVFDLFNVDTRIINWEAASFGELGMTEYDVHVLPYEVETAFGVEIESRDSKAWTKPHDVVVTLCKELGI